MNLDAGESVGKPIDAVQEDGCDPLGDRFAAGDVMIGID
jgi:hypothetical protein